MNKLTKQPLTITKKKVVPHKTTSEIKTPNQEKVVSSQVLDTSGGRMPDPKDQTNITETDVRYAFRKSESTPKT